ncbi:MAG: hypothetical protein KDA79_01190 [Planctomycetaceae bacterium]|nr:hypothetical protein [Planctomycetaceae bacterium]
MTFSRILTVFCLLLVLAAAAGPSGADEPVIVAEPPVAGNAPAVVVEEPPVVVVPPEVALQQLIEAEERRRIAIELERRARLFDFYEYRRSVIRGRGPVLPLGQQPTDLPPGGIPESAPDGKQPPGLPAAAADAASHPPDLPGPEQFATGAKDEPGHPADLPLPENGLQPPAEDTPVAGTPAPAGTAEQTAVAASPGQPLPANANTALTATTLPSSPVATDGRLLRADPVTVQPGGEVTVCVRLFAPDGVARMNLDLVCDPRVAVPTGVVVPGNILSENTVFTARPGEAGTISISLQQTAGLSRDGILAWVRFRAVGQPGQSAPVQVSVGRVQNAKFDPLPLQQQPGEIQIVSQRIPGDSNGDGRVNILDAAAALRMNRPSVPQDRTLDLNQDGKITPEDARLILRQRRTSSR